jgi:hypothetical protein
VPGSSAISLMSACSFTAAMVAGGNSLARMCAYSRLQKSYGVTSEIMQELIASSLQTEIDIGLFAEPVSS